MPAVRDDRARAAARTTALSALVLGVVRSVPMQMKAARTTRPKQAGSQTRGTAMFITKKHLSRRTLLRGAGAAHGAAAARLDGARRRRRSRRRPPRRRAASAASTSRTAPRWTSGRRPRQARGFAFSETLTAARAVPATASCVVSGLAHERRGAVDRRGHGRRREPRARGRGVPERRASGEGRTRRIVGVDRRPGRRRAGRPGHAAAVRRAVDRGSLA